MFERFTDRARKVVVLAQEESRALNHDYIGTEHLLLALIGLEGGVSREVLTSRGYDADTLRAALSRGNTATLYSIPFTPRAKKVIELSLREALQYGHREIDDHHILLGILRMDESTALSMLLPNGSDAAVVGIRNAIMERIPGTTPIKDMRQAILERTQGASPAEETTDDENATLVATITARLKTMPEADLRNLLDSLG